MTVRTSTFAAAFLALAGAAAAQIADSPHQKRAYDLDSGYLHNTAAQSRVVFAGSVRFDQATWLRLHFADTNLPTGSQIRLTARFDGDAQTFDALSLADYDHSSAYFNGNEVRVELVAGPHTQGNRVNVDFALVGEITPAAETICGGVDNRTPSTDNRSARYDRGCTAWMVHSDIALTAGHCIASLGSGIIEFNVPPSTSSGTLRAAAAVDQYPVSSIQSLNNGVGADWGFLRVRPNSQHGQLPPARYGAGVFQLAPPPAVGATIRVTGYGTTSPRDARNQAQTTSTGPLRQRGGTSLCYHTDTTGGNSGSPVLDEASGTAVAIHTHGGCTTSTSSCNSGTRVDRSDIQTLFRQLVGGPPGQLSTFGAGCAGTMGTPSLTLSNVGTGQARIGEAIQARCQIAGPWFQPAAWLLGFSNTTWNGNSLPFDLGTVGMTGCRLFVSLDVTIAASSLLGDIQLQLGIPNDPNLINRHLYIQYVQADAGANRAGVIASNAGDLRIGG